MSEVKVNKLSPRSGTTVTIGDSGDTINIVGTLQNNGSAIPGDISSVVAGTGLSGGGTSGDVTINIEAAQPTITSLGTLTSATISGNLTVDTNTLFVDSSNNRVGVSTTSPTKTLTVAGDMNVQQSGDNMKADFSNGVNANFRILTAGSVAQIGPSTASDVAFLSGNAEKMRMTSAGNVGIGTSSPGAKIELAASNSSGTANALMFTDTDTGTTANQKFGVIQFNSSDSGNTGIGGAIDAISEDFDANTAIRILTGAPGSASERMRITAAGNVGIGKTPSNLLDLAVGTLQIRATPGAGVWGLSAGTDGGSFSLIKISSAGTSNQNKMQFFNTNGEVGSITTNGSATQYETSSDYRLKENVSYDFDATTRIKQLKPARFNFIADADTTVDGFIAHEVSSVVPEAISGTKDAVKEDGTPDYQGIDQSKLVPLLVKTIQELEARITTLENA